MAPSTPPPPSRLLFAAFTMASTFWDVISPRTTSILRSIYFLRIPEGKIGRDDLACRGVKRRLHEPRDVETAFGALNLGGIGHGFGVFRNEERTAVLVGQDADIVSSDLSCK